MMEKSFKEKSYNNYLYNKPKIYTTHLDYKLKLLYKKNAK